MPIMSNAFIRFILLRNVYACLCYAANPVPVNVSHVSMRAEVSHISLDTTVCAWHVSSAVSGALFTVRIKQQIVYVLELGRSCH